MVVEVLDGSLSSDDGLHEEAEHGEHGQAAVLDLLHTELCEAVGVVGQAQGVKGLSRVQGVQTCAAQLRFIALYDAALGAQACGIMCRIANA